MSVDSFLRQSKNMAAGTQSENSDPETEKK